MPRQIQGSQTDFSFGEIDVSLKRADQHPARKAGLRQAANVRLLNSGGAQDRPGRTALFLETGRVDKILMSPGNTFYMAFGNGYLRVYNAAGTRVFNSTVKGDGSTAIPWTSATVKNISFAIASVSSQLSIYITYADGAPNNVPQILTWDGVSQTSTWTLTTFAETIAGSGQKRTFFTRISPQGINLQPSATTGSITLTASANLFVAGMVGTRLLWCGKQVLITGVSSATSASALVIEPLPPAQAFSLTGATGSFVIGDVVIGATTGSTGIIISNASQQSLVLNLITGSFAIGATATGGTSGATGTIIGLTQQGSQITLTIQLSTGTTFVVNENVAVSTGGTGHVISISGNTVVAQLIPKSGGNVSFFTTEAIAGPNGSATISAQSVGLPGPVGLWDDEVMNAFRGYPTSAFFDQVRLGFCNFPSLQSGIGWSAIGLPNDMLVAAIGQAITPNSAIFELAPGKSQVLYVVPGAQSSEFIFCDNAIYYIPISVTNPLVPGGVAFVVLSGEGCHANVRPQVAQQTILYIKAGGLTVSAVQAPGAFNRPYVVDDVSPFHSHLFTGSLPIAIAIPSAATQFAELYAYILLANGSIVVGKYVIRQGLFEVAGEGIPKIGWLPWNGAGTVTWISAQGSSVIFTTSYAPNGVTPVSVVEALDNTQYLDGALSVNNLSAPFTPPGGKGPLFLFPGPNATVTLMDQSTRMMGTYTIDANGFIIPQNNGGENLAIASLVAGQPWTMMVEPFASDAPSGTDMKQRMTLRQISNFAAYIINSTGFMFASLFSAKQTRTTPALGTVMQYRRFPAFNQDDDPTQPPTQRETTETWTPPGSSFDPRAAIIKDTPGPFEILEIGMEISI